MHCGKNGLIGKIADILGIEEIQPGLYSLSFLLEITAKLFGKENGWELIVNELTENIKGLMEKVANFVENIPFIGKAMATAIRNGIKSEENNTADTIKYSSRDALEKANPWVKQIYNRAGKDVRKEYNSGYSSETEQTAQVIQNTQIEAIENSSTNIRKKAYNSGKEEQKEHAKGIMAEKQETTNAIKDTNTRAFEDAKKKNENDAFEFGSNLIKRVGKAIAGVDLSNDTMNTINTVKSTIATASLSNEGSQLAETVGKGFRSNDFYKIGSDGSWKTKEGYSSNNSYFYTAGSDGSWKVNEGFASNKNRAYELGQDFSRGYLKGIASINEQAKETGKEVSQNAAIGVQEGQNSHSPSKIAMALGNDFGEGYTIGIEKIIPQSIRTAKELAKDTSQALSSSVKMSDIFNILKKTMTVNPQDFKIDTNQFIDYGQISGAIATQSNINVNSDIEGRIENAIYSAFSNVKIPVEIEATTDEGIVFKKVQVKAREFLMQTGEPAFSF